MKKQTEISFQGHRSKEPDSLYFRNRKEFRKWLEKNYDKSTGIWMVYYKKHTNTECIEYREALEEALCYGWIDSIIKRSDEYKYVRRFTPRKDTGNWSDLNKRIVSDLMKKGKMTQYGLSKLDDAIIAEITDPDNNNADKVEKENKEIEIPDLIRDALAENEPAFKNFKGLAPSYRKQYIGWITSAKGEDTRRRRIRESIELLRENKRLGLK